MPPTPFPFQLGVGTDIAHIPRIAKIIYKDGNIGVARNVNHLLGQFLTYREQRQFFLRYRNDSDEYPSTYRPRFVEYLAGRWAAKEAVKKACVGQNLTFNRIQILRRADKANPKSTTGVYGLVLNTSASAFLDSGPRPRGDSKERSGSEDVPTGSINTLLEDPDLRPEVALRETKLLDQDGYIKGSAQNDDLPGQIVEVSISHDGDYATAVCIAPRMPEVGDVGGEAQAREP